MFPGSVVWFPVSLLILILYVFSFSCSVLPEVCQFYCVFQERTFSKIDFLYCLYFHLCWFLFLSLLFTFFYLIWVSFALPFLNASRRSLDYWSETFPSSVKCLVTQIPSYNCFSHVVQIWCLVFSFSFSSEF